MKGGVTITGCVPTLAHDKIGTEESVVVSYVVGAETALIGLILVITVVVGALAI